jgi:ribosomal protein S18 acetylase RimI-like enzyme
LITTRIDENVQNTMNLTFRKATFNDLPQVAQLVNSAYRGESSKIGWTTEAHLLEGQRTDAEKLQEMISEVDSHILLGFTGDNLVGSVHLKKKDSNSAYLGMFAVNPQLQASGIGKLLLQESENSVAQWWGVSKILMTVIPLRTELIDWYQRRGYRRTGQIESFPSEDPRFGVPLRDDLSLEVLIKDLGEVP